MFWLRFGYYIRNAYDDVYPATGIDPGDNRYELDLTGFKDHPITRISSFFGLPNDTQPDEDLSWRNILRNFVGLNNRTFLRYVFPVIFLFNLIATPLKFALNIVKLATEFAPMVVLGFLRAAYDEISRFPEVRKRLWAGFVIDFGFTLIAVIPNYIHFMGRSATSPIKGARQAWHEGKRHAWRISQNPWIEKSFALSMAVLSILSTYPFDIAGEKIV